MNLLILSRWLPYPADNGSKLRIYNLIKQLARRGHRIHLISFYADKEDYQPAADHLSQFCYQSEFVVYQPFHPSSWKALLGLFSTWPRSVKATYQPELASLVSGALSAGNIDRLIAFELDMAHYGLLASRYGVPALLEELEVGAIHERMDRREKFKDRARFRLTWFKLTNYLRYLARYYQAITVVSDKERQLISPVTGATPLYVLPNGADLEFYRYEPYRPDTRLPQIIFNGALTYIVNYYAMEYFLAEIFPLLRQHLSLKLLITGKHGGVDLENLPPFEASEVSLTGFVADLRPLITESMVCISPLLHGGGSRLKILEAFALGTPVVSTSKGAEGLEVRHEEHLLIADTPAEFVKAILRIHNDPDLAQQLSANARKLVEEQFDWSNIMGELDFIITGKINEAEAQPS